MDRWGGGHNSITVHVHLQGLQMMIRGASVGALWPAPWRQTRGVFAARTHSQCPSQNRLCCENLNGISDDGMEGGHRRTEGLGLNSNNEFQMEKSIVFIAIEAPQLVLCGQRHGVRF